MANVQIPNLPAAANLSGQELLEVVQAGVSVKATTLQIADVQASAAAQSAAAAAASAAAAHTDATQAATDASTASAAASSASTSASTATSAASSASADASSASSSAATAVAYAGWASAVPALQAYDAALDANALQYVPPTNLYGNPATPDVAGQYISSTAGPTQGDILSTGVSGWARSGYIPITAGQQYTISGNTALSVGASFFTANNTTTSIPGTYVGAVISGGPTGTTLTTGVAPVGANYLVLTVSTPLYTRPTQLQVQLGTSATAYQAWVAPYPQLKFSAITPAAGLGSDVTSLLAFETALNSDVLTYQNSVNLYNSATAVLQKYVSSTTGSIVSVPGDNRWAISDYIPVTPGQVYTISTNTPLNTYYSFFTVSKGTTPIKDGGGNPIYGGTVISLATSLTTVAAPSVAAGDQADAAYIVFTVSTSSYNPQPTQLQLQLGASATAYSPYYVNKPFVQRSSILPTVGTPDYETTFTGKNLFDLNHYQAGFYISSSGGSLGQIQAAAGWGCSAFIPVTPGSYYTISGVRGYNAQCFYTTNSGSAPITTSYSSSPLPVTLKAPAVADGDPADGHYLVIMLYNPTYPTWSNIQVEAGTEATSYTPVSGSVTGVSSYYVYPPTQNTPTLNSAYVIMSSAQGYGTCSVVRELSGGVTLVNSFSPFEPYVHTTSDVFNFYDDVMSGGASSGTFRSCGDDAAPMHAFNRPIGANHGYLGNVGTVNLGHGKTWNDVGSVYTDGVQNFVITNIISTTQLTVTAQTGAGYMVGTSLTHVSGGLNTGNLSFDSVTIDDWFPAYKNRTFAVSIDDVVITNYDNTYYYSNNATFSESYEIMTKDSIVAWLIAHQPDYRAGTYTSSTLFDGTSVMSVSNNYIFDTTGGCTIQSDVLVLDTGAPNPQVTGFNDFMMTQAAVPNAMGGTVRYYIPNALPFDLALSAPQVTGLTTAVSTGTQTTISYTGSKTFEIGDTISLSGATPSSLNVTGAAITAIGAGSITFADAVTPAGTNSIAGATLSVRFRFNDLYSMKSYIASPPTSGAYVQITPARSESAPAWLPNRMVQMNDDYGMAFGYLPTQTADPTNRRTVVTRSAFDFSPPAKCYPHLVDSGAITSLNAGAFYSTIAYRNWFKRDAVRTDLYMVHSPNADYLFVDWHNKTLVDRISLYPQLQGRNFTVETSRNATVLTAYATNTITVNVSCAGDYAFLVLKFA